MTRKIHVIRSLESRFWCKIDKLGEIHHRLRTRCWNWIGSKNKHGYGLIRLPRSRRKILAHRCSWKIHHKENLLQGDCVLHKCDNPSCVNPEHLFIGTRKDNRHDCIVKCRQAKGEASCKSSLTEADVYWIRANCIPGSKNFGQAALARKFGVTHQAIWEIIHGINWKFLTRKGNKAVI